MQATARQFESETVVAVLSAERILAIDQRIDTYIDRNTTEELDTIIPGILEILTDGIDDSTIWLDCIAANRFDGSRPEITSYYASDFPTDLQDEFASALDSRRRACLADRSRGRAATDGLFVTEVAGLHVHALPLEMDGVQLGLLGLMRAERPTTMELNLLRQAESRLDTILRLKRMEEEHHTLISQANRALDQEGWGGIADTLILLQRFTGARRATIVYLDDHYDVHVPARSRRVGYTYIVDGEETPAPAGSAPLDEGLGGNLIEYEGEITESVKAMEAVGVVPARGADPDPYECFNLRDRASRPHRTIGKVFLMDGPRLTPADQRVVEAVVMQIDTKLVHYHAMKRSLARSLNMEQVEFFVHHPDIARWFFETPRQEEISMVFADICNYSGITRELGDPDLTIRAARNWILDEIQLATRLGGYFDKEAGDCAICLFGPPFYEIPLKTLLRVEDVSELEALMAENPPDPERYAFQSVMFALESLERIKSFRLGDVPLDLSIGIEVGTVSVGDLTGNLGCITAIGNDMNLAARLQGLATKGEIVIGPNCRAQLEAYRKSNLEKALPFAMEERPAATLKGFDTPVPHWIVSPLEEGSAA